MFFNKLYILYTNNIGNNSFYTNWLRIWDQDGYTKKVFYYKIVLGYKKNPRKIFLSADTDYLQALLCQLSIQVWQYSYKRRMNILNEQI